MSDTDRPNLPLIWLDVETTGLNPQDIVLEMAVVLTTPFPQPEIVWSFQWLTAYASRDVLARIAADPVVQKMHEDSGLLADLRAVLPSEVPAMDEIAVDIVRQIDLQFGQSSKVQLAGSGVSHYDHGIVKRSMPVLARRLDYATLDVGQLRRWFRAAGWPRDMVSDGGDKPHRAMADVRRAISEAKRLTESLINLNLQSTTA